MIFKPNASAESGEPETIHIAQHEPRDGLGRSLAPGTMLDQYQIQRVLSASGFSVVYLAKDLSADIFVVIKEYLPTNLVDHVDSAQSALRGVALATVYKRGKFAFLSESRTLAACDHPSLVRVSRILELHDTLYRVMPCYYGKTLQASRQLSTLGLDESRLRSLLDGLLGALSTLHAQDCVHGAVSPSKVLWLADDRPLLLDFAAVRRGVVSFETRRQMAMREPSYLPLEQIEPFQPGLVPGPWSDIYSLAAVAYFCIAGVLPARSSREPILDVARRLQKRRGGAVYSAALLNAIDAALAERLQDRPQTATEFRAMLLMSSVAPPPSAQARQDAAGPQEPAEPPPPPPPKPPQAAAVAVAEASPELPTPAPHDFDGRSAAASMNGVSGLVHQIRSLTWVVVGSAVMVLGLIAWKFNQQREDQEILASLGKSLASAAAHAEQVVDGGRSVVSPGELYKPPIDPVEDAVLLTGEIMRPPAAGTPAEPVKQSPAQAPGSPIAACGPRTEFSLYWCVKKQCNLTQWVSHAQCRRLRDTDEVVR